MVVGSLIVPRGSFAPCEGNNGGIPIGLQADCAGPLCYGKRGCAVSAQSSYDDLEILAADVAMILSHQLEPKEILRLQQLVFLEVDEVALLLRVKRKTVQEWVSDDKIPYRKAGGHVLFLLSEILQWTLPPKDKHKTNRLTPARSCKLATSHLAATRERE
jgi:excisionase family DNA binding protein